MNIGLFTLWMNYWIKKLNNFSRNEFISSFECDNSPIQDYVHPNDRTRPTYKLKMWIFLFVSYIVQC